MQTKILGKLEQQVMNALWEKKQASVREIVNLVQKDQTIAYTTIATILQRLFDKKLVDRKVSESHYIYIPKISAKSYLKNLSHTFIKNLTNTFGEIAIVSFVESIENLPEKRKRKLIKLIEYDTKKS